MNRIPEMYRVTAFVLMCHWAAPSLHAANELVLAQSGLSEYVIVLDKDATVKERHGADELQKTLEQISGVRLPIRSPQPYLKAAEDNNDRQRPIWAIAVGKKAALQVANDLDVDWEALGDQGYLIRTVDHQLILSGHHPQGTMYAVFGFLQDYLGCRWYSPQFSIIPRKQTIRLGSIDEIQVPDFIYRCASPLGSDVPNDPDWCVRNRTTLSEILPAHPYATYWKLASGTGHAHSWSHWLPEDLAEKNPEWYAMDREGRRTGRTMCLMNRDARQYVIKRVLKAIRQDPLANPIEISPSDGWSVSGVCACPQCEAFNQAHGREPDNKGIEKGETAAYVDFVNELADTVKQTFPERKIYVKMVAYYHYNLPPKDLRTRENVIVHVSSSAPMQLWVKHTDHAWRWRWAGCMPFFWNPIGVSDEVAAIRSDKKLGAEGWYTDTITSLGDLYMFKHWFQAQLLWNTSRDPKDLMFDFFSAYYGQASHDVMAFYDALDRIGQEFRTRPPDERTRLANEWDFASGWGTVLFGPDDVAQLRPHVVAGMQHAENKVIRDRVAVLGMQLDMVLLAASMHRAKKDLPAFLSGDELEAIHNRFLDVWDYNRFDAGQTAYWGDYQNFPDKTKEFARLQNAHFGKSRPIP